MNENNVLGVVLAGGKSQRFGQDKVEATLGNKTLIEHTLDKIKFKFEDVIIVSQQTNFKDYKIINDCIDGQLGPLVGVLSAMKWIKKNKKPYGWVATFPCDTPFFNIKIIDEFIKFSKTKDSLLYFVKSNKIRHNIFGLWSLSLIETLEEDITKNNYRKVEKWADKIGVKIINIDDNKKDFFLNINTKDDLIVAERILKQND